MFLKTKSFEGLLSYGIKVTANVQWKRVFAWINYSERGQELQKETWFCSNKQNDLAVLAL